AVGGCFPLVFSLLGDLFPPASRAAVSAGVQVATGAGLAAGQALSGWLGPATNWRLPFVVLAVPSLGAAGLMLATTREPPRGAAEEVLRGEHYSSECGGATNTSPYTAPSSSTSPSSPPRYTASSASSRAKLARLLRRPSN
ncbi:hypothetical protein Agub_g14559, partial [Astrephomene gubernaculifera]